MNGGRAAEARARAQAVGAVLGRADELAPSGIEGVDATGSLRMTLGADGLPDTIEVAADWARTLGPDRVGAGVAQAFADASVRRMATSLITGAVTTLTAVLGVQAGHFAALRGDIADNSVFTGGHWPRSTAENYSDATVTDGDAEWSFER